MTEERSTALGTLMGATSKQSPSRPLPSTQLQQENFVSTVNGGRRNKKPKQHRVVAVRQSWRRWHLYRDECDSKSISLGEYLEVEMRFKEGRGGGPSAELEGGLVQEMPRKGQADLFADGRVLPPVIEESSSRKR